MYEGRAPKQAQQVYQTGTSPLWSTMNAKVFYYWQVNVSSWGSGRLNKWTGRGDSPPFSGPLTT